MVAAATRPCGELYALGNATGLPFGFTGRVVKIVDADHHDETEGCPEQDERSPSCRMTSRRMSSP